MTLRTDHPGHRALRQGRHSLTGVAYLVTAVTLGRSHDFADNEAAAAVCRCFADPANHGDAQMLAWVLMPDHAHWLIELGERDALGDVVGRLKAVSARALNRQRGRDGVVWAPAYHDRALRTWQEVRHAAAYVVRNPLRAGLADSLAAWPHWYTAWSEQH
jgi:putative transposase